MQYVTVFLSSENQMDADNEQMQLFEPVEMDDYNEAIHERVEFVGEISELEVAEDECNSDIETSVNTEHDSTALKSDVSMTSDKPIASTMKVTDYRADESIATSMHGIDRAQGGVQKQHFRRKQNTKAKFECTICGKVLSNQSSHKYHMQLHSAATPFLCSECGKGFKTRNAYDGHMVTHLPSNPNTCDICGNSYRQAASLRSHMLVHSGEKVNLFMSKFLDCFTVWTLISLSAICVRYLWQRDDTEKRFQGKTIHNSQFWIYDRNKNMSAFVLINSLETYAHTYWGKASHLWHLWERFSIFEQFNKSSASTFGRAKL